MKKMLVIFCFSLASVLACCVTAEAQQLKIDPGRYDGTWWNRAPMRLIQTNLREIDATMDTDAYVQSMVDASASVVLINVGGIVANYPTRLPFHFRNPFMKGDLVGDLVKKLHSKGIRVIGRFDFSKLNESLASQKPGWLYVGTDGKNVNYNGQVHTCINGGYQQEYAFEILKEAITTYPLDGIFFNMIGYTTHDYSGVNHGFCQCDNCRQKFHDATGYALPRQADMEDPVFLAYNNFKKTTSEKLFNDVKDYARKLDPKLMIYTYTDAGVDMIASESGASLAPGYELNYSATDNVKRVLGSYKDRTPGNLLIYFQAIGYRHVGTSPNLARVWMLENMLHGAPLGFVVVGTLVNYEDRVFMPVLNDLYSFHKTNEKLFTNVQSPAKVALIRGSTDEYEGLIRLLTEEHILFDVIEPAMAGNERTPRKLQDYDAVILGDVRAMSDTFVDLIDAYVRQGGNLLSTGFTSTSDETGKQLNAVRLKCAGVEPGYELFKRAPSTYLRISDHDKLVLLGHASMKDFTIMMMYSDFMKCRVTIHAEGLFRLVPETRFGPPEKSYFTDNEITEWPGLVVNPYGTGMSVLIPWMLGAQYQSKGHYMHRTLFATILEKLDVSRQVETNASSLIELSYMVNRQQAFEWIGMINHSGQLGASLLEPVTMHDLSLRFRPQRVVKEVRLMRSGKTLPFRVRDGWIECTVPRLGDFEMVTCFYK